jgi:D-alanyl-D-alanine dipeptidase
MLLKYGNLKSKLTKKPLIIFPLRQTEVKVRSTVAEKILQAQGLLPQGINFLFEEGWRPLSIQKEIFNWYYNKLAAKYPNRSKDQLYLETCKYVSPYDNTPAHSTGGAFDISLCDEFGNELEMGSNSDDPPELNENRGYTNAENISSLAKTNRQILTNAMHLVGFVNYPYEWWHWSYGDRYWAFNTGKSFALYGSFIPFPI